MNIVHTVYLIRKTRVTCVNGLVGGVLAKKHFFSPLKSIQQSRKLYHHTVCTLSGNNIYISNLQMFIGKYFQPLVRSGIWEESFL